MRILGQMYLEISKFVRQNKGLRVCAQSQMRQEKWRLFRHVEEFGLYFGGKCVTKSGDR